MNELIWFHRRAEGMLCKRNKRVHQLEISRLLRLGMKGLWIDWIAKHYAWIHRIVNTRVDRKRLVNFAQMQFQGAKKIATSKYLLSFKLNSNEIGVILWGKAHQTHQQCWMLLVECMNKLVWTEYTDFTFTTRIISSSEGIALWNGIQWYSIPQSSNSL